MTGARARLLALLAGHVAAVRPGGIARVAVDGVDGAGKTTFADQLADALAPLGRPVVRAGVDGFHHPRAVRHRRGRHDPEGFFADSYDYPALRRALLDPLAPGGDRLARTAVFDHTTDRPVEREPQLVPGDAVLLLDGIFLHRDELAPLWDCGIFLRVRFAVSGARMAIRDGSDPDPGHPSNRRYVEGQRRYLSECHPEARVCAVVDHDDLRVPVLLRLGSHD
ncbi:MULTISPECIES: uridine kinase [Actinosynnema]|uniref:uridine kinase n=1 Tax=Actinosynnema TaxID=40566 RepID=UPI0020A30F40|nr:uridine kinase [Actinosynnema pretiosum]MCP2098932.1 uridine kinase [Actinosynnema pretiosum]